MNDSHDARPDDDPEPGDRCKDCEALALQVIGRVIQPT
jgi:hypothetical protein